MLLATSLKPGTEISTTVIQQFFNFLEKKSLVSFQPMLEDIYHMLPVWKYIIRWRNPAFFFTKFIPCSHHTKFLLPCFLSIPPEAERKSPAFIKKHHSWQARKTCPRLWWGPNYSDHTPSMEERWESFLLFFIFYLLWKNLTRTLYLDKSRHSKQK